MKREKTVVDVSLSEDQKNEMHMRLVREQTVVNRRLSMEHRRHEDIVSSFSSRCFLHVVILQWEKYSFDVALIPSLRRGSKI
jgi:hypothetical protein